MTTTIVPQHSKVYWLKLQFLAPLSHHDPGQADKSNFSLFRRQKQFVGFQDVGRLPTQEEVNNLCQALPVPPDMAGIFEKATLPQFIAAALTYIFVDEYGAGDGQGLFEGAERYERLTSRFQLAAVRANTLGEFWSLACQDLQIPMSSTARDDLLLKLFSLPASLDALVLHELSSTIQFIVMLGRRWAQVRKDQSEAYAERVGREVATQGDHVLHFDVGHLRTDRQLGLEVPAFSANSIRHEIIREPSMLYLLRKLEIDFDSLPGGIAALLYNGNNIEKGAKEPGNSFGLRQVIMARYPHLALIGGSADGFILGNSNLSVNAWLVCKENNDALALAGIQSKVSIFDMLDEETLTRHSGRVERGQMPFTFEVLAKGTPLLVRLGLSPYTRPLEVGALASAIDTYEAWDGTLGGQSARGFGLCKIVWRDGFGLEEEDLRDQYDEYLEDNKDELRQGLLDGTLGTGTVVCR
ncbi:MAG: hypothetical protein D6706_18500 [Chloroflexi bacterium]|nr:MAG: hypothetical protein D6706_18500 [Chloroflexota bacterium]